MLTTHTLSAAHLRGIGLVAAEWSYSELALESLIWEVGGIENDSGYAITTHIGSETRIHILEALAEKRVLDDGLRDRIRAIAARIRSLRTDRNNIVHAVWFNNKPPTLGKLAQQRGRRPTPSGVKINAKGKVKITATPYPSKTIMATAEKIGELVSDMYVLLSDLVSNRSWLAGRRDSRKALVEALSGRQKPARDPDPKPTESLKP